MKGDSGPLSPRLWPLPDRVEHYTRKEALVLLFPKLTAMLLTLAQTTTLETVILYGDPPLQFPSYEICQVHQCFDSLSPGVNKPNTKSEPHTPPQKKQTR